MLSWQQTKVLPSVTYIHTSTSYITSDTLNESHKTSFPWSQQVTIHSQIKPCIYTLPYYTHTILVAVELLQPFCNIQSCTLFTSCQNRSENEYLWCHEWDKHGTCASGSVQQINTEFDFFSKVLDLFEGSMNYDKYVLAKHDIIPSTSKPYTVHLQHYNTNNYQCRKKSLLYFTMYSWKVLWKHFMKSGRFNLYSYVTGQR